MLRNPQPFLGPFAIFDVGANAVPLQNLSLLIPERYGSNNKPAEFPVGTTEPNLILKGHACCRALAKSLKMPLEIVGVNCGLPAQTGRGEARILDPTLVYGCIRAIGEPDPHHCRNRVHYLAQFSLAPSNGLFGTIAVTCDSDGDPDTSDA
ncbi:hypothetical protein RBB80_25395 [Tunturiibacter gelidiferens]